MHGLHRGEPRTSSPRFAPELHLLASGQLGEGLLWVAYGEDDVRRAHGTRGYTTGASRLSISGLQTLACTYYSCRGGGSKGDGTSRNFVRSNMSLFVRHRAVVRAVVVSTVTIVTPCRLAQAQTSTDHEIAVAAFREARKLIDANDCPSAMVHLERSLAREPSIGARMSMAECQEKSDPVRAWRSYADGSLLAYTNHDERLSQIEARMLYLERRVGTFHLGVAGADLTRAGLDVRLDGQPLDRFLLRRGIVAVEPGEHVVEASAPDRGTFVTKVSAPVPGGSVLVPITLPERPPPAPASACAPAVASRVVAPAPVRLPEEARLSRRTVGLYLGAVGVVGLVVGGAFGLVALGRGSDLDEACGGDRSRCAVLPSSVASIHDAGTTAATVSTVSFVVGGVALATGIALAFWPSGRPSEQKVAARGHLRWTPAGVGVGGAF